jgi:outer membrane autotransporter protein
MKRGNFTFGPITSLQYTYFGLQPFTETGAQSLDLSVASSDSSSLVWVTGSHCLYNWQVKKNLSITPQVSLGWQHEFLQNPYTLNSSFSNGSSFGYTTTAPERDSLFSSIGFNINFAKKYDLMLSYTASSCNPTLLVQGFNASLGMSF